MKRKGKMSLGSLLILGVALGLGCAGGAHYSLAPNYKDRAPCSIAVLPVLNETVSLKAPEMFRPILLNKLRRKGYETPALAFIDGRLKEKEIHEAGQVNTLTPQELGNLLGVDALLYTYITEFSTTYLLAYASMTVGARFELKDAKTGEKLWESAHQAKESKLGLDQKSVGDTLQFAAGQSYLPYAQKVVDASFQTLPNGPRAAERPKAGCVMPGF